MDITKCDVCKKIKKEKNRLNLESKWIKGHIFGERSIYFDLCEKCSAKLLAYLKKYLKIKKEE
ncbi:MAG: hypothetical protein CMI55_02115 [Parcubacteria group bacterium]|jgi:hypothetical protein|nr:hypothetical protein [Parcubacteria group bacterium]|tara:strand:+ start:10673 stop:10861 length:189 start_codon:yes stop_codon:yes gene_type:complete